MKTLGLLILCLTLAGCGAATSTPPPVHTDQPAGEFFESEDYFVVVAKSGDTTQTLAAKHLGDANKDWMIEEYNETATLMPGQAVAIPKRPWNLSGVTLTGYQLVPILVYHDLAPQAKGRMVMGVKGFEEQMRYLKANGYRVITLKEYVEFVSLKRQLPKKSVLITFDDGYRSFVRYAYPVLKELGFSATLFIYTDYVAAGGNAFTWPELKKLSDEGFAIQAHSKSHGDMVRANAEGAAEYDKRLESELVQPKALFQKNLGYAPDIIAYPYGRQDDAVVRRTKERGYVAAFTVRRQGSQSFVDPHRIHRIQIYPEMRMDDFVKSLSTFSQETIK
ncbi:MAG TPA: polysaccharide deacetylase family protein [Candidatus Limnocylindria bacterium]|nr:polysaccharide deacetylase family protein [Candidatus Limnocylindria bacterium]